MDAKSVGLTRGVLSGARESGRPYNERRKADDPAEQQDPCSTEGTPNGGQNRNRRVGLGRERGGDQPTGSAVGTVARDSRKPQGESRGGHRESGPTPKTIRDP